MTPTPQQDESASPIRGECDCIRPVTPAGIYHETTCVSRASAQAERNFQRERDEARDLLARVYDQAVLNRGYVTSALLDEIRSKGLGS